MSLKAIIPDGGTLLAMTPEDLAIAILRNLNASDASYARRGLRENIILFNYSNQYAAQYQSVSQPDCARAISAGLQHLINIGMLTPNPQSPGHGCYVLTDRAKAFKDEADYERYRHAARYPRGAIHPAIEQNTYSEFMKGDYDTAVFKAFKTLEDTVRRRAGFDNSRVGVTMMRDAFHSTREVAPLTDKTEEGGEREALMFLMAGALGRFKNPSSHRFTGLDDPVATIEILQLASLLLRIAEQRPTSSDTQVAASAPGTVETR